MDDEELSSSGDSELEVPKLFRYEKESEDIYDDFTSHIRSVTFETYILHQTLTDTSALTHRIEFPTMVSLTHAVRAAEDYLTVDVTKEYCDMIRGRATNEQKWDRIESRAVKEQKWDRILPESHIRGDILTKSYYVHRDTNTGSMNAEYSILLKDLNVSENGDLTIICTYNWT